MSSSLGEEGYAVVLTRNDEEESWYILANTIPDAFEAVWKLRTHYPDRAGETFGLVVYELDTHQEIVRIRSGRPLA